MNTWICHFIFPLTNKFVNMYLKQNNYKNEWILHQYSNLPKRPTAETTHGRNDSRPKRPTKIGRIDSPQNKAETTQAETTRPKRPRAETTRIRKMYEYKTKSWRIIHLIQRFRELWLTFLSRTIIHWNAIHANIPMAQFSGAVCQIIHVSP